MALTRKFEKIGLSLSYHDGITIYPNIQGYEYKDGVQIPAYDKQVVDTINAICNYHVFKEERLVHRVDSDHALYHNDGLNPKTSHFHVKFSHRIDKAQLQTFLEKLVTFKLLSIEEKTNFLLGFSHRFWDARYELAQLLMRKDKNSAYDVIIAFIQNCKENDILGNIHTFLLSEEYDFLRQDKQPTGGKQWLSINTQGQTIITSAQWARIEKAISLQMAHNILALCPRLIPSSRQERARQLVEDFKIFAIKHKTPSKRSAEQSSMAECFIKGDNAALEQKYNKFFGK